MSTQDTSSSFVKRIVFVAKSWAKEFSWNVFGRAWFDFWRCWTISICVILGGIQICVTPDTFWGEDDPRYKFCAERPQPRKKTVSSQAMENPRTARDDRLVDLPYTGDYRIHRVTTSWTWHNSRSSSWVDGRVLVEGYAGRCVDCGCAPGLRHTWRKYLSLPRYSNGGTFRAHRLRFINEKKQYLRSLTLRFRDFRSKSSTMPIQSLSDVYIDEGLLKALLTKLFGRGQYRLQVGTWQSVIFNKFRITTILRFKD